MFFSIAGMANLQIMGAHRAKSQAFSLSKLYEYWQTQWQRWFFSNTYEGRYQKTGVMNVIIIAYELIARNQNWKATWRSVWRASLEGRDRSITAYNNHQTRDHFISFIGLICNDSIVALKVKTFFKIILKLISACPLYIQFFTYLHH